MCCFTLPTVAAALAPSGLLHPLPQRQKQVKVPEIEKPNGATKEKKVAVNLVQEKTSAAKQADVKTPVAQTNSIKAEALVAPKENPPGIPMRLFSFWKSFLYFNVGALFSVSQNVQIHSCKQLEQDSSEVTFVHHGD